MKIEPEHSLILYASRLYKTKEEEKVIDKLLSLKLNWINIIGLTILHRLCGYFWFGLTEQERKEIPSEFRHIIKIIVQAQESQNLSMLRELRDVFYDLNNSGIQYAGLQGIIFINDFYPLGIRRFNDVDIIVRKSSLKHFDNVIRRYGFIQSLLPNGEFIEASMDEKKLHYEKSKDVIPYIKKSKDKFLKIDVDYAFDTNNNIDDLIFSQNIKLYSKNDFSCNGFSFYINLIQLCLHFFYEGTNANQVFLYRDILLFRVVDIVNLIYRYKSSFNIEEWILLVNEMKLNNPCYYTFYVISEFYVDTMFEYIKSRLEPEDCSFIRQIYFHKEKKYIIREESFYESAFNKENMDYKHLYNRLVDKY